MPRLHITPHECIACNNCELACSFRFSGGAIPLGGRAISIAQRDGHNIPMTCFQCEEAACVAVCPADALVRNEETKAIEVIAERCIGCKQCVAACPFGHMTMDTRIGVALKCDLCHGAPTCAMFCPTKALVYE